MLNLQGLRIPQAMQAKVKVQVKKENQLHMTLEMLQNQKEQMQTVIHSNNTNDSASDAEPTPYDFGDEPKGTDVDSNPFADFGSSIEISDDELPF